MSQVAGVAAQQPDLTPVILGSIRVSRNWVDVHWNRETGKVIRGARRELGAAVTLEQALSVAEKSARVEKKWFQCYIFEQ